MGSNKVSYKSESGQQKQRHKSDINNTAKQNGHPSEQKDNKRVCKDTSCAQRHKSGHKDIEWAESHRVGRKTEWAQTQRVHIDTKSAHKQSWQRHRRKTERG